MKTAKLFGVETKKFPGELVFGLHFTKNSVLMQLHLDLWNRRITWYYYFT